VRARPEVLEAFKGRLDKRELFRRSKAAAPVEGAR
jgi:hypothetical protein